MHIAHPQPQDAIETLTADHRHVEALWKQAQAVSRPGADALDEILRRLSIHDGIEKQLLYPVVRDRLTGGGPFADRSLAEHQKVEELLAAAEKAGLATPEGLAYVTETMEHVREHVSEEEAQIFPALRSALSHEELVDLASQLDVARALAPTHPHPATPNKGIAGQAGGVAGGLIDKAKDAVKGRPSNGT